MSCQTGRTALSPTEHFVMHWPKKVQGSQQTNLETPPPPPPQTQQPTQISTSTPHNTTTNLLRASLSKTHNKSTSLSTTHGIHHPKTLTLASPKTNSHTTLSPKPSTSHSRRHNSLPHHSSNHHRQTVPCHHISRPRPSSRRRRRLVHNRLATWHPP